MEGNEQQRRGVLQKHKHKLVWITSILVLIVFGQTIRQEFDDMFPKNYYIYTYVAGHPLLLNEGHTDELAYQVLKELPFEAQTTGEKLEPIIYVTETYLPRMTKYTTVMYTLERTPVDGQFVIVHKNGTREVISMGDVQSNKVLALLNYSM